MHRLLILVVLLPPQFLLLLFFAFGQTKGGRRIRESNKQSSEVRCRCVFVCFLCRERREKNFCLGSQNSEILYSFSFRTNTKKLDLARPFDRNLSHSSLPVIRERERESKKSKKRSREFRDEEVTQLYIRNIYI